MGKPVLAGKYPDHSDGILLMTVERGLGESGSVQSRVRSSFFPLGFLLGVECRTESMEILSFNLVTSINTFYPIP